MITTAEYPRSHVRTEVGVEINATVTINGRKGRCTVENISPGGARVITRVPLTRGQDITLDIDSIGSVEGKVAWTNKRTYGVKFSTEMDAIADLLLAVAIY